MKESLKTRLLRWGFNLFPAYRRTGARLTHIAGDFREVRIKLPLNWKTRNYVGTLFGGSMFGAVDGVHMVMLMKLLGPGYSVWDRGSSIRFLRPGRTTLYTRITIDVQEIESIRAELAHSQKLDHGFQVEWVDDAGEVHASIEKTIHVRRRYAATDESPARAARRQRVAA